MRWEHKIVQSEYANFPTNGPRFEERLNELGADGWELVGVCKDMRGHILHYMKRAK